MNRACHLITCIGLVGIVAIGCEPRDQPGSTNTSSASAARPGTSPAASGHPEARPEGTTVATATKTTPAHEKPTVTWKGVGFEAPESVLYDDVADVYLVSNVVGKPTEVDGKGFISRLSPDGKVEDLKWIESGKEKVTLNAPKGMALSGDLLYVADLDTVRMFDRKTGAPKGEIKIPGSTFLNGVSVDPDGRVLVSDTGLKGTATGTESTGNQAIYEISPGKAAEPAKQRKVTPLSKEKDLGGPNGIAMHAGKTWVVGYESGELYTVDAKGKKGDVEKLPKGRLDGVVAAGNDVLVSSWDAHAIYRVKPGGAVEPVIENVKSPADIGYDAKRGRVLVPLLSDDEVRAYDLK